MSSREVSTTSTSLHFNSRFFYLALFAIIILSLAYFLGVFDQRKNKKNSRKEKIDEPSQDDDNLPSRARHLEEFQNSGIQRNISPSVPIHHIKPSIIPRIIQSKKLYDPSKIDERMSIYVGKFLASNNDDIDIRNASIPGIGPSAIELLEREKIFLVCQLIGKFLSFKRAGITTQEHCDFFLEISS